MYVETSLALREDYQQRHILSAPVLAVPVLMSRDCLVVEVCGGALVTRAMLEAWERDIAVQEEHELTQLRSAHAGR